MKTRLDARIWVLTGAVIPSLRKRAATISAAAISNDPMTPAQVERVRTEMVALADGLQARADKLIARRDGKTLLADLAGG